MIRKITFKGSPLTLVGRELALNKEAPGFKVVSQDLKEVSLSDFNGKTKVLTSFPSIDTPVCDLQVKEFNKKAVGFSSDVAVLGVSKDLPFAQKRFCQDNSIKNVVVLSDYKTSSFGIQYGLLIKELNLLARSIMLVDKYNTLRYAQIVKELTDPPDCEDALTGLQDVIKNPRPLPENELPSRCVPCEGSVAALPKEKIDRLIAGYRGWELLDNKKIVKEFKFKDFAEAKYFADLVSLTAEEQGHHPVITLSYGRLKISLTTHAASGLTDNDFIMARIIDELRTV